MYVCMYVYIYVCMYIYTWSSPTLQTKIVLSVEHVANELLFRLCLNRALIEP